MAPAHLKLRHHLTALASQLPTPELSKNSRRRSGLICLAPLFWRRAFHIKRSAFPRQPPLPRKSFCDEFSGGSAAEPEPLKVSDALGRTQNTWKPPDQSSLHNVCRTGIWPFGRCKLLLLQRIYCLRSRAAGAPLGRQMIGDAPCACEAPLRTHLDTNRIGGAERDRTADPLLAKQVLSQLSYSPTSRWYCQIQPREWWARADSNCRPHAYQACALTT